MSYKGTKERRQGRPFTFLSGFGSTFAVRAPWIGPRASSPAIDGPSVPADDAASPGPLAPISAACETGAPAAVDDLCCVRVLPSAVEGLLDPVVDAFHAA